MANLDLIPPLYDLVHKRLRPIGGKMVEADVFWNSRSRYNLEYTYRWSQWRLKGFQNWLFTLKREVA